MNELLNELLNIRRVDELNSDEQSAEDVIDRDAEAAGYDALDGERSPTPHPTDDQPEVTDPTPEDAEEPESQDPDKAGLIRTVKGAHLSYKRQQEDGSYEELWVYKADSLKSTIALRNAILAGTDIEQSRTISDDGEQEYEVWTVGNVEMLRIVGLPN